MEQALRLPDASASSEVPATSSVPATSQKITSLAANQSIMPFDLMDESSSETTFRVAFYIRVSTDTEDQLNSFVAQRQACYLTMSMHPEYILTNIYADEAISGTQAAKRPGFMKMIQDAEAGLIDLIITKSLSRWSRNTLDSLTYMRRLMDKGVNFLFEREGIDTRNHFSEFAVTLYSAFAQEESRSISENTKMGIRMQFSMGQARWCPVFGYKRDNEEYEIDPDQAIVVRDIFSRYETGTAIKKIADHLNESGIPTVRGGKWSNCTIAHILGNRKYVGDLPMQSFYTKDHISHAAVKNNGDDIPTYMVENHHKAIISREQFDRVQTIMKLRNPEKGSFQYPFGDMLHCPYCSGSLTQHRGSGTRRVWFCQCGRFALPAWTVEKSLLKAAEGLDVEEIEKRSKDEEYSASARLALELIRGKMLEKVEYHWIDKMISGFDFELLPADTGCNLFKAPRVMMTVRWKFGIESRMIIDHLYRSPEKLAQRMLSMMPGYNSTTSAESKQEAEKPAIADQKGTGTEGQASNCVVRMIPRSAPKSNERAESVYGEKSTDSEKTSSGAKSGKTEKRGELVERGALVKRGELVKRGATVKRGAPEQSKSTGQETVAEAAPVAKAVPGLKSDSTPEARLEAGIKQKPHPKDPVYATPVADIPMAGKQKEPEKRTPKTEIRPIPKESAESTSKKAAKPMPKAVVKRRKR